MTKRYQDYVIRDGRLVGEFEQMYRNCPDPWHQSRQDHRTSYARNATLVSLQKFGVKSLVEWGCGLGYFTDLIARETGVDVIGMDVSATAVAKASARFPHLRFEQADIRDIRRHNDRDAVLLAEITWYILDEFDQVLDQIARHWAGKLLFHNLVFYKGDAQKYGREYFTTLDELIARFPFDLVARVEGSTADTDVVETSTVFRVPNSG